MPGLALVSVSCPHLAIWQSQCLALLAMSLLQADSSMADGFGLCCIATRRCQCNSAPKVQLRVNGVFLLLGRGKWYKVTDFF